jgi:Glyoxalase-like domain
MFHTVPEGQTVKNRGDFDLQAADAAAEADRLTRLGARQIRSLDERSPRWPATLDRSAPTPPKREMLLSKGVAS